MAFNRISPWFLNCDCIFEESSGIELGGRDKSYSEQSMM